MKKSAIALALALGLFAAAAHAQADAAATQAVPASTETTVVSPDSADSQPREKGCVRESGTLLGKRDKNGCTGAAGQSYSREDIDRTGAIDTGDAIRKLSPRASLRRGG